jgi:adenosine deaminase
MGLDDLMRATDTAVAAAFCDDATRAEVAARVAATRPR